MSSYDRRNYKLDLHREKVGDLTQSYDKTPYTNRKFENQKTTHTDATKNVDYTTHVHTTLASNIDKK